MSKDVEMTTVDDEITLVCTPSSKNVVINDKIKLQEIVGEGSFGLTYKGKYKNLDAIIKIQKVDNISNTRIFGREMMNLLQAKPVCDNIVCIMSGGIIETVVCDGKLIQRKRGQYHYYIVMEYIKDSITLTDFFRNNFDLDVNSRKKIFSQLVNGLMALHSVRLIHSDIKPDNIMINKNTLKIKYIDLGVSCFESVCRRSGTPNYMAPELSGSNLFEFDIYMMSDWYSLGLVIYQLLTNRIHSRNQKGYEITKILDSQSINPDLEYIRLFATGCLMRDPKKRKESITSWMNSFGFTL